MKKILVLFIIITAVSLFNKSQGQDDKICGPYHEKGKNLTVYFERRGGKCNTLYGKVIYGNEELKTILNDRDALKKQERNLKKRIAELEKTDTATARLRKELDSIKNELEETSAGIAEKEQEIARLNDSIQKTEENLKLTQGRLAIAEKQASDYAKEIDRLLGRKLDNIDYLSIRAFLSSSTMYNDLTKQNFWIQEASLGQSYQLTYTKYFSSSSSAAITIGVGLERYRFSANIPFMEEYHAGLTDPDGDEMDLGLQYNSITENVSLTYLNVPIELHIGNNTKGKGCQPWVDAGFLLSINTGSTFEGTGMYSNYGYYPQWDLRVSDEPLLGLTNSADAYSGETQWGLNGIVLWGILGVGVNVPISDSHWAINAGARCAYSLTAVSKEMESDGVADTQYRLGVSNLLGGEGTRIFNWGISLGISYSLEPVKIYDIPNEQ